MESPLTSGTPLTPDTGVPPPEVEAELPIPRGWRLALRLSFILCIIFPALLALVASYEYFPVGLLPLLPFAYHVWKFESVLKSGQVRYAAALAIATGVVSCLSFSAWMYFVFPDALDALEDGDWSGVIARALAVMIPMPLVFSAAKVWQATRVEHGPSFILAKVIGIGVLYMGAVFITGAVMLSGGGRSHGAANEASVMYSLRRINAAMATYESTYHNGFASNLAALGPPRDPGASIGCNAAGLINEMPASGQKSGYIFDYEPGPSVATSPAGCAPGVKSYTLSARPVHYPRSGMVNFFTDQSGVIRSTYEDRPATEKDPPLQ